MYTVVISEHPESSAVVVSYHQGEMPAHETREFPDVESAKASEPTLVWREPDEDDDGDVLAVATFS